MDIADSFVPYLASVASASLFYLSWSVAVLESTPAKGEVSVSFNIGLAIFFWLFGGMGAALLAVALPWYLAVRLFDRLKRFGLIYFSLFGAATLFLAGCATSSLSPKALFIEDQTFFEGFVIAAYRQGVCLALTGLVFGLTFWFVGEHLRQSRSIQVGEARPDVRSRNQLHED